MTEKMQEVARLVPPGGAFQGAPSKVFPCVGNGAGDKT